MQAQEFAFINLHCPPLNWTVGVLLLNIDRDPHLVAD
jgi:hypothetical protein